MRTKIHVVDEIYTSPTSNPAIRGYEDDVRIVNKSSFAALHHTLFGDPQTLVCAAHQQAKNLACEVLNQLHLHSILVPNCFFDQ